LSWNVGVQGEALLSQDKCGEAIRSLQESKKLYREAREFAAEYAKTKVSQAILNCVDILKGQRFSISGFFHMNQFPPSP
jgi:hypothetical protein